jgi:nucleoside-diphosphate-sugar epimerase
MKIAIIGGEGFLGTHIALRLKSLNHTPILIGNGTRNTYKFFTESCQFFKKDITFDYEEISELTSGFDVLINCAAIAGVSKYHMIPATTARTNILSVINCLDIALYNNIRQIITISSSEACGYNSDTREDSIPIFDSYTNSRLTYCVSKYFGDILSYSYYKQYGLNTLSIRPFGIYGPGQIGEGAIQIFCRKAIKNEDIPIVEPGTQLRCWCYIDDFVDSIISCIDKKIGHGEVINIGGEEQISVTNLASKIIDLSNSKSELKFVKRNVKDNNDRPCELEKAISIIRFQQKVPLDEGLKKTIEWYKINDIGEDMKY